MRMEKLFRYLDPVDARDELSQIVNLLAEKPVEDRRMAPGVLKQILQIFERERNKRGK